MFTVCQLVVVGRERLELAVNALLSSSTWYRKVAVYDDNFFMEAWDDCCAAAKIISVRNPKLQGAILSDAFFGLRGMSAQL